MPGGVPQFLRRGAAIPCLVDAIALRSGGKDWMPPVTLGLSWIRRRQRDLARAVLALFVLAWLQAAALPCVMAHSGASGHVPAPQHCPYCPAADGAASGSDDGGSCSYPHGAQVDVRVVSALFLAMPATFVSPAAESRANVAPAAATSPSEPIPRVPIPLSYCRLIE